jgi:pyrroloquinoline quinone biosynthesis protein D
VARTSSPRIQQMTKFDITTATFALNPRYRLQWEPAQNCHVLLYPEGLIQLSGSAAEIMQRCVQPTTLDALVADLEQQFPNAEGIAEDVREFLQDAQQQHWIVAS